MFKRLLSRLGLLMIGVVLSACTSSIAPLPTPSSTDSTGKSTATSASLSDEPSTTVPDRPLRSNSASQVLTLAYSNSFPDLDPSTSFSSDNAVLANVYEPLVWYKPSNELGKSEVQPGLAERWMSSADGKQWTFFLRKNVVFHDGTPFTAEAVKFSIERTKKLNGGAAWIWSAVNAIEVKDPYTVVMTLDYPVPLDLVATSTYAAWMISPLATDQDANWFNGGRDAGTGPYTIEQHHPGQRVILKRFDRYWGGWKEGQFEYIILEVVEDPTVRRQKIETGEADWTFDLPTENLAALDMHRDVRVVSNPAFQSMFGLINTRKKPLDNPKVRQALSYSFPYENFIQNTMGGYAMQSFGAIPKGMFGHDDSIKQYTYNLERAKALLHEAGLPDGGIELTMTYVAGNTVEQQAGELWKAELQKLGITLRLQPMTWEAQWALAKSDPQKAQDIFVMYWWPTYVTPYDFLFNMFHSEEEPNFNLGYYRNEQFDRLIDRANEILSTDKIGAEHLFKKAQEILVDDAAAIFFFDQMNLHAIREDINGYVDNPAYAHVVFAYELSRHNKTQ